MPHAEHEVTIERPPDDVFAFLADGENDPRWRAAVIDCGSRSTASSAARSA